MEQQISLNSLPGPLDQYPAFDLASLNERVDALYVDDELLPGPKTIWSE